MATLSSPTITSTSESYSTVNDVLDQQAAHGVFDCPIYTGEVSIAWFGAVPDDPSQASANSAAINAAVAAAQAGDGTNPSSKMSLHIPHGTFYLDEPIVLESKTNSVALTIRGESSPDSDSGSPLNTLFSFFEAFEGAGYEFCDVFLTPESITWTLDAPEK